MVTLELTPEEHWELSEIIGTLCERPLDSPTSDDSYFELLESISEKLNSTS